MLQQPGAAGTFSARCSGDSRCDSFGFYVADVLNERLADGRPGPGDGDGRSDKNFLIAGQIIKVNVRRDQSAENRRRFLSDGFFLGRGCTAGSSAMKASAVIKGATQYTEARCPALARLHLGAPLATTDCAPALSVGVIG